MGNTGHDPKGEFVFAQRLPPDRAERVRRLLVWRFFKGHLKRQRVWDREQLALRETDVWVFPSRVPLAMGDPGGQLLSNSELADLLVEACYRVIRHVDVDDQGETNVVFSVPATELRQRLLGNYGLRNGELALVVDVCFRWFFQFADTMPVGPHGPAGWLHHRSVNP